MLCQSFCNEEQIRKSTEKSGTTQTEPAKAEQQQSKGSGQVLGGERVLLLHALNAPVEDLRAPGDFLQWRQDGLEECGRNQAVHHQGLC